jgi:hypothetical protein
LIKKFGQEIQISLEPSVMAAEPFIEIQKTPVKILGVLG